MSERLFRAVRLPSDEPVQYVGVYVLKWGRAEQPTIGFVEVDDSTPDLLVACQSLERIVRGGMTDDYDYMVEELGKAQAAIAKATRERHMSKHTPGPWEIHIFEWNEEIIEINAAGGYPVAKTRDVAGGGYRTTPETNLANACLIAQSPTMLEALEWLIRIHDGDCSQEEYDDAFEFAKEVVSGATP